MDLSWSRVGCWMSKPSNPHPALPLVAIACSEQPCASGEDFRAGFWVRVSGLCLLLSPPTSRLLLGKTVAVVASRIHPQTGLKRNRWFP